MEKIKSYGQILLVATATFATLSLFIWVDSNARKMRVERKTETNKRADDE